jgi:5-methylcytosine-specific restriction endonuclease McrA
MLDMVIKFYRGMCAYCGCAAAESWDHVVPISKHGPNTVANLVPSCVRCNMTKGTQMWEPRRMHPYA